MHNDAWVRLKFALLPLIVTSKSNVSQWSSNVSPWTWNVGRVLDLVGSGSDFGNSWERNRNPTGTG